MKLFDDLFPSWSKYKQQMRLAELKYELEQAQEDCAALGAHIGRLIQKKTELETELMRKES